MFIVPLSQIPHITPLGEMQDAAEQAPVSTVPFADMLKEAMQTMEAAREVASADNVNLALGDVDNLHQIQINSVKAATATEFTMGLASRAITAYKEILNMQI